MHEIREVLRLWLRGEGQRSSPGGRRWTARRCAAMWMRRWRVGWLLRCLIVCGPYGVHTNCHRPPGGNGTFHHYYSCRNHDTLRAGKDRRCPERNIRADALDTFVFDQVRAALLRPEILLAGEGAIAATSPVPDDEVLATELAWLDRKLEPAKAERRRLADL